MTASHYRRFPFLLSGALLLLYACSALHHDTGFVRVRPTFSRPEADARKQQVLAISNEVFAASTYHDAGNIIPYRLLSPLKVAARHNYPLVLVLHSSGTPMGTDNVRQLGVMAKLWAQPAIRAQYPAYVLVPQFPARSSNYSPLGVGKALTSTADPSVHSVLRLIDSLKQVLPINPQKIYVVGFSMGASTALNCLGLRPNLFAAAVSISGIPEFRQLAVIASKPVWFIHGNADAENPIASDSLLFTQLTARHARKVRYWEVEKLQHEIYPYLYLSDAIPAWLFKH